MSPVLDGRERLLRELATEVGDPRVLDAIASVPRQAFVPEDLREFAWLNQPLPIGEGQSISQPVVVAHMCELLRLTPADRVLDVGTGSGYHAALLSRLVGHVHSIERRPSLARQAAENLRAAGIENVTLIVGDGTHGYAEAAPYDAINVAAASQDGVPPALEGQLARGGRMIIPTGGTDRQRLVLVERLGDGEVLRTSLQDVRFVPLVGGTPGTS
ncbi:MAG TPA: protein-L-isoaspartate(D-aspartate) O-methyltransferase [Solirubrobacteraceae bacterium]